MTTEALTIDRINREKEKGKKKSFENVLGSWKSTPSLCKRRMQSNREDALSIGRNATRLDFQAK